MLGGYSIVWTLRVHAGHRMLPLWWLVAALVAFDCVFITLDTTLNALFAKRLSFPLLAHLRSAALRKVFEMPPEWHQRETSGALVAKMNNGVGQVVISRKC